MAVKSLAKTSPSQTVAFQWCLTIVSAGALVINFLVIIMFVRFRQRLLSIDHNLILFSLAIADFAVGIGGILGGQLYYFLAQGEIQLVVYKLGSSIPYFGSFFISISTLAIMTADRVISVKFPLKHLAIMTRSKIISLIAGAWSLVTILVFNQGVIFFAFKDNGWTELRSRALLLSIFFTTAVVILSISNAYLFMKVRGSRKPNFMRSNKVGPTLHEGAEPIRRNTRKEEAKSSKICIWLTVLFIVCWFPAAVYYLIWLSTGKAPIGRALLTFCLSLASANSLLNPVVYLLQKEYFRDCLKSIFSRNLPRREMYHNSSTKELSSGKETTSALTVA